MSLSYAEIQTRALQLIQDTGGATYDTTEMGMWIEDELKRIEQWDALEFDVIFQVESRRGNDVTGTASSLTDTVKGQFLAADATKEKVVHNITDDTWAVILANSSTSVNTLSRDIMASGEQYEIYNKRCRNKRQIYIGDMPSIYRDKVIYVEYRGKERGFKLLDDKIELLVEDNTILDSNTTLTNLNPVDVLVTFQVPHILSQLTAWTWELTGDEVAGATDVDIDVASHGEGTIEIGEQFHVENHRSLYIVNAAATITTNGRETATIFFYPPLEAAASDNDEIIFRKSTLTPDLEAILPQRLAARGMLSNTVTKVASINPGGVGAYERERQWAFDILGETERSLRSRVRAKPSKTLPRT